MAEDLPERSQASFTNQPDLDELAPDPPRLITADDIPRDEPKPLNSPQLITAADIPGLKSKPEQPTTPNNRRPADDGVEVGRTLSGVEALRLRQASRFDEPGTDEPNPNVKYGRFDGRPIIGHDTRITGGVYIGGGAREAIVVDDHHSESTDPNKREQEKQEQAIYDKIYTEVLEKVISKTPPEAIPSDADILQSVYDIVYQVLQYNEGFAHRIKEKHKDQEVNLSGFIDARKGVCRHQALLVGYLLERLIDEGKLHGKASIQRNAIDGYGAHAWANFTAENGTEYIVDVAQEYVGRAKDAPDDGWIYIGH